MRGELFIRRTRIEAPAEEVFRWHTRPGALERLAAPWEKAEVIGRTGGLEDGARVVLEVRLGPIRRRWVSEHRDYQEGRQFRDVQIEGPFSLWDHTYLVEPKTLCACWLEDRIEYAPADGMGREAHRQRIRTQ